MSFFWYVGYGFENYKRSVLEAQKLAPKSFSVDLYDDLGELEARSDARAQEEDQSEHDHAPAQRPWEDDEHVAQALWAIEFARDTLQAEPSQLSTLSHTLPDC